MQFDPFEDDWARLGQADVLINCVGQIVESRGSSFQKIHEGLTKLIIQNRGIIGNPRIIQVSALGASPDHHVKFLSTKGVADELLLQEKNTFVLRPSIVCTPGTMIVKRLMTIARIVRYTGGWLPIPKEFLSTRLQPVLPDDILTVVGQYCQAAGPSVINIAGHDVLTFGDLLSILSLATKQKFRIITIPKFLTDFIVPTAFSKMVSPQQYQLLFEDNTADTSALKMILNREPASTKQFFINEFSHATY